jgi:hypothetical protein
MKASQVLSVALLLVGMNCISSNKQESSPLKFSITFTNEMSNQAQDGRLLLMLSGNDKTQPRFQISNRLNTQLVFGVDAENVNPREAMIIDASAFGFPIQSLSEIR